MDAYLTVPMPPSVRDFEADPDQGMAEKAYQQLRRMIITLELPPSAILNERQLVQRLSIGRTPIREALQRLAAEGLVAIAPRRAIFVSELSLMDLQKIFEMREVLEGFCAELAAESISPRQLDELDRLVTAQRNAPGVDSRALMALDERFHTLIYDASGNQYVSESLRRLYGHSQRLWYAVLDRLGDIAWAVEQDEQIAAALRLHNRSLASSLVRQHVAAFQQAIKAVL